MTSTTNALNELRDLILLDAHRTAEVDYPGFVSVEHIDGPLAVWCIGDANGDWGADLQTLDGDVLDSFTVDGSAESPIDQVAIAIMAKIKKIETGV